MSGGGSLRATLAGETLGVTAGVTGLSPVALRLDAAKVRLTRVPLDLGVRARIGSGDLDLFADLGIVPTLLLAEGLDAGAHERGLRLEVGGRVAGLAAYWMGDFAPFLSIEGVLVPFPYDLVLHTTGTIGQTPRAWAGASAGALVRFR
jgi:hypothetical protein